MLQYSSAVCCKIALAERDGYLDEEGNLITLYFVSRLMIAVISTSTMCLFFWEGRLVLINRRLRY